MRVKKETIPVVFAFVLGWMTFYGGAIAADDEKSDVKKKTEKLWEQVNKLVDSDKMLEVQSLLEQITRLDPKDVQAWTFLGWYQAYNLSVDPDLKLNEQEMVRKGINTLKRGVEAVPDSADVRFELGMTYYDRVGDCESAAKEFEEALRLIDDKKAFLLDPDEKRPLNEWRRILMRTIAHVYERNLDLDRALTVYERMIKEYDDEDVARFMANYIRNDYGKAREFMKAGRYRDAVPEIDSALQRRVIAIGLYLKAECHTRLGEVDKAKQALILLLQKNPRERVARNRLEQLMRK